MKELAKKALNNIKQRCWYIVLLLVSSMYVWSYRNDIYKLTEFNTTNLIFIIWIILLMLPLFSEMEFLGVKIKKEVKKETEEIRELINKIQLQVNQLQLSNSIANNINLGNVTLPSKDKLEELLRKVTELQNSYPNTNIKNDDLIYKGEDSNLYLFRVRLSIETFLREMCEKIGYTDRMTIVKMMQILNHLEIIDAITCDLITQVNRISNRGVHGEIVSKEYLDFVKKTYPEIARRLQSASSKLGYTYWNEV